MNPRSSLPPEVESLLKAASEADADDLKAAWDLAEGAHPLALTPAPEAERVRQIEATLLRHATPEVETQPPFRLVRGMFRPWMAVAAAVAFLIALGVGWWLRPVTITVPEGQRLTLTLPDGSEADLNSGSSLSYTHRFGKAQRNVALTGEAFFDVLPSDVPFVIETMNTRVTVLGTTFNVRAWPSMSEEASQTVVSVISGRVQVAPRQGTASAIVLGASQMTQVAGRNQAPAPPSPALLDEATAWREGGFVFFDQPYSVIFDEMERRFGIEVIASEEIRARRHTFVRHQVRSAAALVSDFCLATTLRYRTLANGFEIYEE